MSTLVMKFGGTSTSSVDALNCAADIVGAQIGEWDQIVVVVSAMGGVTDLLLESADRALDGSYQITIAELHQKLASIVGSMKSAVIRPALMLRLPHLRLRMVETVAVPAM